MYEVSRGGSSVLKSAINVYGNAFAIYGLAKYAQAAGEPATAELITCCNQVLIQRQQYAAQLSARLGVALVAHVCCRWPTIAIHTHGVGVVSMSTNT